MALSPEVNDVDIRALFEYRKPVTLYGVGDKNQTIHMRVIGDAELQRARIKALRNSRQLRKQLKDEETDQYMAYVPDISSADKSKILEMTLLSELRSISKDVAGELEIPFPEEPDSDGTLEDQEEYQKEVDDYPAQREAAVKREIIKRTAEKKKELKKQTREELMEQYLQSLINELCEIKMTKTFYDYVVFFSVYSDEDYKKPLFKSFEEFDNLPTEIKDFLLTEYRGLELGLDDLKK